MVLAPPSRGHTFAIIALLAILIIHPVVSSNARFNDVILLLRNYTHLRLLYDV